MDARLAVKLSQVSFAKVLVWRHLHLGCQMQKKRRHACPDTVPALPHNRRELPCQIKLKSYPLPHAPPLMVSAFESFDWF